MPFHSSPLLHGARPAAFWRAPHDATRVLAAVEQLAARLMHAPLARLWLATDSSEPARELAPAADEVVARKGPLVVADRDSADATPVTRMMHQLRWRALAAVPLHDASGGIFAVLIAADARRRMWTEEEVLHLRDLAALAALAHPRGHGDVRFWLQRLALEAAREARRNLEAEHARGAAVQAAQADASSGGSQYRRW